MNLNLNLTEEEFIKAQIWLIEKKEKEDILGDIESFDITGW